MSGGRPRLVPELVVSDLERSVAFWCGLVGFRALYDRPEDRFAFLDLDGAEVMLEQRDAAARQWLLSRFAPPLGVGADFQIGVRDLAPMLRRLREARWPLVLEPEDRWYCVGDRDVGQRQFVVADPDGYLLRPAQEISSGSA